LPYARKVTVVVDYADYGQVVIETYGPARDVSLTQEPHLDDRPDIIGPPPESLIAGAKSFDLNVAIDGILPGGDGRAYAIRFEPALGEEKT